MDSPTDLPVCTLFNDATEEGVPNAFSQSLQQKMHSQSRSSDVMEKLSETETHPSDANINTEPVVCNLFQSVPSSEDLFASITPPAPNVNDDGREVSQKNVDKTVVAEVALPVDAAVAEVEVAVTNMYCISKENNLNIESLPVEKDELVETVEVNNSKSDIDNTSSTLNNSDLLSSVVINDSLDNLSNLSFEQNTTEKCVETSAINQNDYLLHLQAQNADAPLPSTARIPSSSADCVNIQKTASIQNTENVVEVKRLAESKTESSSTVNTDKGSETFLESNTASTLFAHDNNQNAFDVFNQISTSVCDDAFTSALETSEIDRRRDAWIPNENTQAILTEVAQSQKRIKLNLKSSARPGLASDELISICPGGPVQALLDGHYSGSKISDNVLTVDDVTCDKNGLRKLIASGNHRGAADLCAKVLTNLGQGFGCIGQEIAHSAESVQWWHVRLSLLLRLRMYNIAEIEFEPFGSFETPDLYYGFYPDLYPGRHGSLVPFSFRLLHADFPRHLNRPNESLVKLYALQSKCIQILTNLNSNKAEDGTILELKPDDKKASISLWTDRIIRIKYYICNSLLQLSEYSALIQVLENIIVLNPVDAIFVQSAIGRILLQLGDITAARDRFARAEQVAKSTDKHRLQLKCNIAFLYMGTSKWKEALNVFNEMLEIAPNNILALNNKAVCLLYMCRLKEAVQVQKEAVGLNKGKQSFSVENEVHLESAITNLITLYELETSYLVDRKLEILSHLSKFHGDGFNIACLKL